MEIDDNDPRHSNQLLRALLQAGKVGMIAQEAIDRTGLSHSQVQAALSWLRGQQLVEAKEDATE